MREIKFRAWDGKRMSFVTEMTWTREPVIKLDGFLDGVFSWSEDGIHRFREDDVNEFGELELMQFTGLHDKNGKEIYEGDVVVGDGTKPQVVEFKEGVFGCDYGEYGHQPLKRMLVGEVIGNIYENPELIK